MWSFEEEVSYQGRSQEEKTAPDREKRWGNPLFWSSISPTPNAGWSGMYSTIPFPKDCEDFYYQLHGTSTLIASCWLGFCQITWGLLNCLAVSAENRALCHHTFLLIWKDTFVSPRGESRVWRAVQADREKAISVSSRALPAVWTFIIFGNKEKGISKDCLQLLQDTIALKGEPGHYIAVLFCVWESWVVAAKEIFEGTAIQTAAKTFSWEISAPKAVQR